jgi:hypothetical protein
MNRQDTPRFVLRDLTLPARLVIAVFLICVGLGYASALVNLHFQGASAGKLLPDADETANLYYGLPGASMLERLIVTDESKPFSAGGTMRQAFTSESRGWKGAVSKRAREKKISKAQAEEDLRKERDGEMLVLVDWIRAGLNKTALEKNDYPLPRALAGHPITAEFVEKKPDGTATVRVGALFAERCARCHNEHASGLGAGYPLQTWEQIHDYAVPETSGVGMSLKKLAMTTHTHLLSLGMLFALTGVIFAFSSYPCWLRGLLAPLPLLAQIADISLMWLGRTDPMYGRLVVIAGAVVACGLGLQILLTLLNLFGRAGKLVIILLLLAAGAAGVTLKQQVIDPYLASEGKSAATAD